MAGKEKKTHSEKESASSQVLRKFKTNPLIYIGSVLVLVLVTVTFVGGDLLSGGRVKGGDWTFGYYDNVPISFVPGNIFSQYWNQIAQNMQNYYMVDTNDPRITSYIWQQAFESTAVHIAILRDMKRSNYEIPEKIVNKEIVQMPEFQENGRFSLALYNQLSETRRLAQLQQVRDELTKIVYFSDLYGLLIPDGEADFIANMSSEKRSFEMVFFRVDDYPDSEYLSFANENSTLFGNIHLSRITVNSEREAAKILTSVMDGTSTFEDAARTQSQDYYADRGGDMGVRYVYELNQEIPSAEDREKIIALETGQLSDVVNIDDKWVFFRVEDQLKPPYFEDDAVMEKVRSYMRNNQRGRMEDWAIDQARDFIAEADNTNFDDAAFRRNKEKRSFGPIAINYGNIDLFPTLDTSSIPELAGSATNENFWITAFSTEVNTLSEPLVQGGNVLVLYPTEIHFAEESDVKEIALNYSAYWLMNNTEISLQPFFMNSSKMDDRFQDTYYRLMYSGE